MTEKVAKHDHQCWNPYLCKLIEKTSDTSKLSHIEHMQAQAIGISEQASLRLTRKLQPWED